MAQLFSLGVSAAFFANTMTHTFEDLVQRMKAVHQRFHLPYTGQDVGMIYNTQSLAEWLEDKDEEYAEDIEAAIVQYAESERWPELNREQSLLVCARARCALWFLRLLMPNLDGQKVAIPIPQMEAPNQVLWLLQYVWSQTPRWRYTDFAEELKGEHL